MRSIWVTGGSEEAGEKERGKAEARRTDGNRKWNEIDSTG